MKLFVFYSYPHIPAIQKDDFVSETVEDTLVHLQYKHGQGVAAKAVFSCPVPAADVWTSESHNDVRISGEQPFYSGLQLLQAVKDHTGMGCACVQVVVYDDQVPPGVREMVQIMRNTP